MNPLGTPQFRRVSAHCSPLTRVRLATPVLHDTVRNVVAVPLGAETHCLNRYPSPKGRTGCPQGRPPRFFIRISESCAIGRTSAEARESRKICFQWNRKRGIPLSIRTIERGKSTCAHRSPSKLLPWHQSPLLRPVATLPWNRRSWAAGPVRPHRSCLTATWQPGLSSGLRPTSPIARNTRRAADSGALTHPAQAGLTNCTAIAGHLPGGGRFSYANNLRRIPSGYHDGRDKPCSRRS